MKKLFILHGWTYTTDAWQPLLAQLRKAGIEPVMLQVPGLTAPSSAVWDVDKYVEWLAGELPQGEVVALAGHSNGGRISIAFSAKYPERVGQLILMDAAGIVHHEFLLEMKRSIFGTMAKIGKVFTASAFLRKVLYRLIGAKDYERAPENMRATMKNLIERDLTPELSDIVVPTLIIWGKKDTATPISDACLMKKLIPHAELEIIPDAAHSPHKTHPEKVSEIIASWLQK